MASVIRSCLVLQCGDPCLSFLERTRALEQLRVRFLELRDVGGVPLLLLPKGVRADTRVRMCTGIGRARAARHRKAI